MSRASVEDRVDRPISLMQDKGGPGINWSSWVQCPVAQTIVLRRLCFSSAETGHKKRWPVLLVGS
jgi:hypothetical protein